MGFSVHIDAKPDPSITQRKTNFFIHPFCTSLSDVWITCGEGFASAVRALTRGYRTAPKRHSYLPMGLCPPFSAPRRAILAKPPGPV